jgi:hypothetical protein
MNSNQSENIPEQKKEQQQQTVAHQAIDKKEEVPAIKSEENQENWKRFREQREIERKQKEESDKRAAQKSEEAEALKAALEALTSKPSNNHNNEDIEETEDQRIDKRVETILAQREAEKERKRLEQEHQELPKKLRNTYQDFDKVCSQENLDYLDYHYPEITRPLKRLNDDFEKWTDIYNTAKKLIPNTDSKKDLTKADKNLQKPGSVSSAGPSNGGNTTPSYKLSEERKAANYERMQRTIKGLSS